MKQKALNLVFFLPDKYGFPYSLGFGLDGVVKYHWEEPHIFLLPNPPYRTISFKDLILATAWKYRPFGFDSDDVISSHWPQLLLHPVTSQLGRSVNNQVSCRVISPAIQNTNKNVSFFESF